jgi:glucosylceramidase
MTDASAELLSQLPDDKRRAIMEELFSRKNGGLGLSFTRLTVGASIFRVLITATTIRRGTPDPELKYYRSSRHEICSAARARALAINPDLKVMISRGARPRG